jgi:HAMP domain-containing protein
LSALVFMRIAGFVRGGRALAPLIAVLVELGVIYGGGASPAAVAYGYSALALFPVLAWLTKLLLDTEPDGQRRLARLSVGPAREATAGILAATVLALVVCAAAMAAPWVFNGIDTHQDLGSGIALGVLAHLLALPPAVAVGALASRAVTGSVRLGVTVLVVVAVLVVVLGLSGSWAPWLVPPVMAMARELTDAAPPTGPGVPPAGRLTVIVAWAVAWCAVAFAGYGWLRRRRS